MSKAHKNKLSIAMLGHKRIPSREGGVEIVVEELSSRMAALGHSVTCYNRKGHHVSSREFDTQTLSEYKGIKIKTVLTVDKRGLAAMTASFFAAVAAAFSRCDIVHFHAEGPCAMLWLPKLFGKRCIATIHGLDHQRTKWGRFASWYIRVGEKCAAKYADEIIVLSKGVQEYFRDTYSRETELIPNGIEKPYNINPGIINEKYGLEKDSYILYLSRLVPEKGAEYLIDAYRSLETDKKLVIAGGSSDTKEYESLLKEKACDDNRIIFTGFVQGQCLEELYSNSYIYVLPSDLEGMPLSLLEAMSYGNCCLTSDIPECTDVTEQNGVAFKKGNVNDLREKLEFLCQNPQEVEKYKKISADFILNKYNWDDIVLHTLKIYGADISVPSNEDERVTVKNGR